MKLEDKKLKKIQLLLLFKKKNLFHFIIEIRIKNLNQDKNLIGNYINLKPTLLDGRFQLKKQLKELNKKKQKEKNKLQEELKLI